MLSIAHIRLLPLLLYLGLAFSVEAAESLGKPEQMYNHSGQLKWDAEYDSYGNVRYLRAGRFKGFGVSRKWPCSNYRVGQHHCVAVSCFGVGEKNGKTITKLEILGHNLLFVGWNINTPENGISLPYYLEEMVWHDLQAHRGTHPKFYFDRVEERLKEIEKKTKRYCTDEEDENKEMTRWTILEDIKNVISDIRNDILNYKLLVHGPQIKWRIEAFTDPNFTLGQKFSKEEEKVVEKLKKFASQPGKELENARYFSSKERIMSRIPELNSGDRLILSNMNPEKMKLLVLPQGRDYQI